MRVRLTSQAAHELGQIADYLDTENPYASIRVEQALKRALSLLAKHPFAGRLQERGVRRLSVTSYPYLIFYRIDEAPEVVSVLSIRHAARRPEVW